MPQGIVPKMDSAVKYVTSGTYQADLADVNVTETFGADVEFEIETLADNIVAAAEDKMYSWIRLRWYLTGGDEEALYEWYVVKCLSTDALQNMSDATVLEDLQRKGEIIERGLNYEKPTMKPRLHTLQYYKMHLNRGYELRFIVRPLISGTAAHGRSFFLLEWREIGA